MKETRIDNNIAPSFSVIIPTYQRPKQLYSCLEALAQQDYPKESFEVIVVDDGGCDSLDHVIDSFRESINVTLLRQPHAGPAAARNEGAAAAKGKYFVFTDDDCLAPPNWLRVFHKRVTELPEAAFSGRAVNILLRNPYATASEALLTHLRGYYNTVPGQASFVTSNNLCFPAKMFRNIGGYDTRFPRAGAEDRELCDRWLLYGYAMDYTDESLVHHAHMLDFRRYLSQHFAYGRGAFIYHQKRIQSGRKPLRVEPLQFYQDLFGARSFRGDKRGSALALLLLSQVANAGGYFAEKARYRWNRIVSRAKGRGNADSCPSHGTHAIGMPHQSVGSLTEDNPETFLKGALALAVPAKPVQRNKYLRTKRRSLTRRGVIWLGQTCNLRCNFCYYVDRVSDPSHSEHEFMPLAKAKAICKTLVDVYGNNAIDIQGGEPTLYPGIYDLVGYCHAIGLQPTIITNGQVLADMDRLRPYKEAGIRDFLVSVHALGLVYDRIVGRSGSHVRQMKALRNLQEVGIPFRFNCVLACEVLCQLPQIAKLAAAVGAVVVNFIAFNPYDDQRKKGNRSAANIPRYRDTKRYLDEALDILASEEVEVNVRNLPLCMVAERHRPSVYNHQQITYDLHENEFAGWAWTGMQPQRVAHGDLTPPLEFGPKLGLGPLRRPLRWLGMKPAFSSLHGLRHSLDGITGRYGNRVGRRLSKEEMYRREAKLRAHDHLDYRHVPACKGCDVRRICDGFHGDYVELYGGHEAEPIRNGQIVDNPKHYIQHQRKVVFPTDDVGVRLS